MYVCMYVCIHTYFRCRTCLVYAFVHVCIYLRKYDVPTYMHNYAYLGTGVRSRGAGGAVAPHVFGKTTPPQLLHLL